MSKSQEQAFVKLVQEHSGIIHKVIHLYVNSDEDRRDLHQEIMLQAWKSFPSFRADSKFSTWLYRVSLNTVLTFNRKEQKREALQEMPTHNESENEVVQETSERLYLLIKQLDEIDRMLMTMHLDGYKNPEIAATLGLTTNHVNVKIHRLKNQIIEALKL